MKAFVVVFDEFWLRDGQRFDASDIDDDEFSKMNPFDNQYDDRWRDCKPLEYVGCAMAENPEEAVKKIATNKNLDSRQLCAIDAEEAAKKTEWESGHMVYTITDAKTGRSYTAIGFATQSLETVWNSQKCFYFDGNPMTITAPDGRKQTFCR